MADAEYVISIAAAMPEGATTIEELDKLTASLTGAGKRSDDFQSAIKRVSSQLDVAKASSVAANEALAVGADRYRVLERDAIKASKALEKAQAGNGVPLKVKAQADAAAAALHAYAGELAGLERNASAASKEQDKLARQLSNVNKLAGHVDERNARMNQRYEKLQNAVSRLPGPLGRVGGQLVASAKGAQGLSQAFTMAQIASFAAVAGIAAVVVVLAAVVVAAVAGYVAMVKFAVGSADAARSAALSREAFAALNAETAAGVAAFDEVSAATGQTDAQLVALTKQLRAAGVEAGEIPAALKAAALAEAALGQGGSSEFVERLKSGELAVSSFAAEAEAKFGGVVAKQLRGLDALGKKLDKSWAALFSGVDIEPVLDALAVIVGMFDKANPLAQAFGLAVEGAFEPVSKYALAAAYAVEAFALGFAIQLAKLYLAVRPAIRWIADLFGFDGTGLRDVLDAAGVAGKIAAGVFVVIGVALGVLVAGFAMLFAPVAMFAAALGTVVYALSSLGVMIYDFVVSVVPLMIQAGADLMMGLVEGITGMVGAVVTAVSDAVTGAIDIAKDVLGISSPSKVFAEIGTNTVAGFTGAVDEGSEAAAGSMASLVGPGPAVASAAATTASAGGSAGRAGGGKTFDFAGATFNFSGVANAESAREMFAELLTTILEGDADSLTGAQGVPA